MTANSFLAGFSRRHQIVAGIAAVGVVAVIVSVAGSKHTVDLEVSGGKVANLKPFLQAATGRWEQSISSRSPYELRVGKGAGCYYVKMPGTNILDGMVACGPVRSASSAPGAVWDTYTYGTSPEYGSGSTPSEELTGLQVDQSAVTSPAGVLVNASGHVYNPSKADQLAAPPLAAAPAGLLESFDASGASITDPVKLDPSADYIVTPAGTLTLTSIGHTASVPDPSSSGQMDRPAPGYQFDVFGFSWDNNIPKADSDTQTTGNSSLNAQYAFVAGSSHTTLQGGPGTFVASVKKGSDAFIDVSVAGADQEISVVSGKRVANPVAAGYYVANREFGADKSSAPTSIDDNSICTGMCPDYSVAYDESVSNVAVTAYDFATNQWAPAGKEFLEVSYSYPNLSDAFSGYGSYNYVVDQSGWTAVVAGTSYHQVNITSQSSNDSSVSFKTGDGTFLIPAGTSTVELKMPTYIDMSTGPNAQQQPPAPAPFIGSNLDFTATFG